MKIVSIVGARPQFIKLAPLSKKIRLNHQEVIIHTGQHYDTNMSDLFFNDLKIPTADYNLSIGSQAHGKQTAGMLKEIEDILLKEKPDCVLVFGDTNTTLAGALAAVKLNIKTVHIEAGLRSFNRHMPEEINRVVADHTSDLLFAPTKTARENLINEGLEERTVLTGDIMVDALMNSLEQAKCKNEILSTNKIHPNEYYLLTLHRPYNVDNKKNIVRLLNDLSSLDKVVVFPAHPRTRKSITYNSVRINENIILLEPVGYLDFLSLQLNAYKIITDSGGIQKEAYILGKPCITLRSETEWVETVNSGWNLLVNPGEQDIKNKIISFTPTVKSDDIFGSNVSDVMVDSLNSYLA